MRLVDAALYNKGMVSLKEKQQETDRPLFERVTDRAVWDGFVSRHVSGSFLQSFGWGELKAQFGWRTVRLGAFVEGRLVAGAQVLFRDLPLGTLAYIPRGPLADDPELLLSAHTALAELAREEGAFCLEIEPALPLPKLAGRPTKGFQPRSTILLDLAQGVDELWSEVSAGTRYNVRLAKKRGLTVVEGGLDDISVFYSHMVETSDRAGFAIHSRDYYERLFAEFGRSNQARLFVARSSSGEALASALILRFGSRAYHLYSGSVTWGRKDKPNDLLLWEIVSRLSAEGVGGYDLWGIPDEVGQAFELGVEAPRDGAGELWGVYSFKRGFGGRVARSAEAFDWALSPSRFWLWRAFGQKIRRLRGKARPLEVRPRQDVGQLTKTVNIGVSFEPRVERQNLQVDIL